MFKNLSDNLNILMAKARLTSSELARFTGIPATSIKRIKNNEHSNPTVATLLPIAKYFSMTVSELLAYEDMHSEPSKTAIRMGLRTIPILTWSECIHYEVIDYSKITNSIYTEKHLSSKGFALKVEGQEIKYFPEKSYLLVEPNISLLSGDFVIVVKDGQGTSSVKKYIAETDQVYLKSLVDAGSMVPYTAEYLILGAVIQYKVEFRS